MFAQFRLSLLKTRPQMVERQWVEGKKGKDRVSYPFVTGKGITVTQGVVMPEGKIVPVRKTEEVEV